MVKSINILGKDYLVNLHPYTPEDCSGERYYNHSLKCLVKASWYLEEYYESGLDDGETGPVFFKIDGELFITNLHMWRSFPGGNFSKHIEIGLEELKDLTQKFDTYITYYNT